MLLPLFSLKAQTKNIGECALQYSIVKLDTKDTVGVKWVYVKGDQCKTTIHTPQLIQTLYFNAQSSTATITKDIGESHFIQEVVYPPIGQPSLVSMKEIISDSLVQLLGFTCKQIELKWSDGVVYQIWYTPEMMTTVSSFELAFKEVGGLVLCRIPAEFMKQRDAHFAAKNKQQMDSVDNTFMQDNDPRMAKFAERKSQVTFGSGI